jgi:hypothetical protein
MAISTYIELKTAIDSWLARDDLTSKTGDFIMLAEARLNRICPLNVNRVDLAMTCASGSRNPITFPTDFVEPIALYLTTNSAYTMLLPKIAGTFSYGTTEATPVAWCINGSAIDLDSPCDAAHTFSFRYRKSFTLSDSAPTNWLLTNHPDVYLHAALVEAEMYLKDFEAAAVRLAMVEQTANQVSEKDARNLSMAPLVVDRALRPPAASFDYTVGF